MTGTSCIAEQSSAEPECVGSGSWTLQTQSLLENSMEMCVFESSLPKE